MSAKHRSIKIEQLIIRLGVERPGWICGVCHAGIFGVADHAEMFEIGHIPPLHPSHCRTMTGWRRRASCMLTVYTFYFRPSPHCCRLSRMKRLGGWERPLFLESASMLPVACREIDMVLEAEKEPCAVVGRLQSDPRLRPAKARCSGDIDRSIVKHITIQTPILRKMRQVKYSFPTATSGDLPNHRVVLLPPRSR
jgi:hypothetical protein